MPQLHFYVPEQIAERIREKAEASGLTLSKYLSKLVCKEFERDWPQDYFKRVLGGWQGEPLERAEQGMPEERELL